MRNLICICCPKGCSLEVDENNGYTVTGNSCERGSVYGRNECIAPVRTVTSTIKVSGGTISRCPVKTSVPIPKEKVFDVIAVINQLNVEAPVQIGQIILSNVEGADIVAVRNISSADCTSHPAK